MRWNETCVLIESTYEPDGEGVPTPTEERTDVFCNPRTVGAAVWSSMYEIGISCDAQIQVRTCDYNEQRDVEYRGRRYSVEVMQERGDYTVLTLRHQKSDSEREPGSYQPPAPTDEPEGESGLSV